MSESTETRSTGPPKTAGDRSVTIRYFALFQDETGRSREQFRTNATTPAELFDELSDKYDLDLDPNQLQVALNHEMSSWDNPLQDGDTVAFLPPVAGG